uniref:Somatostatin-2 n=1 Tax=Chitala chitala TaxID=112163 RepID=Q5U7J9_CHICT|nr:preprosomatostatin-II [Chitala chitala]
MKNCQAQCILALMGLFLGLCWPSDASQPDLRYRSLLQRAHSAPASPQDWTRRTVEDLLARLPPPEGEFTPVEDVPAADEGEEVRVELERSVDPNNLPPRERKAGCKNFYWKGFTSC